MKSYVKVMNWIDDDAQMYGSTKHILVAMLLLAGGNQSFTCSQEELAKLSGYCRNTVRQAISELQRRGMLLIARRYGYSKRLKRIVRYKTRYRLLGCNGNSGYTLLPSSVITAQLTALEFATALHIYRLAGRTKRAYPSLRRFARQIDRSKSGICRALRMLELRQIVNRNQCKKANRAYTSSSYYPIDWVRGDACREGGLKFEQPQVINKITGDCLRGENKVRFREFGSFTKYGGAFDGFTRPAAISQQLYFDGTGVKVFAADEQDWMLWG